MVSTLEPPAPNPAGPNQNNDPDQHPLEPGHLPSPYAAVSPPIAPIEPSAHRAKTVLTAACVVMGLIAIGTFRYNADRRPVTTLALVVAAGSASPVAAPTPESTVVPSLAFSSFIPAAPAVPADLSVYNAEFTSSARPYIAVDYTGIIENAEAWSSHLFGPSDIPATQSVPLDINNEPLCMVAQLNLADLPVLPVTTTERTGTVTKLPKAGMLQFWLKMVPVGSDTGWTGGPTLQETVNQPAQRVTYVSPEDMAASSPKMVPQNDTCSDGPPSRGPTVALAMNFSLQWNVPETTDARFDSALPFLAGALRAADSSEFYRALGSINSWLGTEGPAQIGGFNRLVDRDPRTIDAFLDDDVREGLATDLFEVLFEMHSADDPDSAWSVGFGAQGTGGWWVDPVDVAKVTKSGTIVSAFWWDAQVVPDSVEGETEG